jgi:hypothetical protein
MYTNSELLSQWRQSLCLANDPTSLHANTVKNITVTQHLLDRLLSRIGKEYALIRPKW